MNQNPLITIIIPVYNVEAYIEQCLQSVVEQSYTNLEILVIDDASPDASRAIIEKFVTKDNRVKLLINTENRGLSNSRNKALALATGEYLCFIDSDDWVDPLHIEDFVNTANQALYDIIMKPVIFEYSTKADLKKYGPRQLHRCALPLNRPLSFNVLQTKFKTFENYSHQFLFKTSLIKDNNLCFKSGLYFEDILFTWQAIALSQYPFIYIENPNACYHYRYQLPGSITTNKNKLMDYFFSHQLLKEFLKQHNLLNATLETDINYNRDSAVTGYAWCLLYGQPLEKRLQFSQALTLAWQTDKPSPLGMAYRSVHFLVQHQPWGYRLVLKVFLTFVTLIKPLLGH